MANLETLELTISANAQSATKGLGKLISSLSHLSSALSAPTNGLVALNAQLKELKSYGSIKLQGLNKAVSNSSIKQTTEDIKEQTAALKEQLPMITNNEAMFRNATGQTQTFNPQTNQYEPVRSAADMQQETQEMLLMKQEAEAASTAIRDLISQLNTPINYGNFANVVNQLNGIGQESKSAADSAAAFMQEMQKDTPIAQSVREANPELQEFCQTALDAGTPVSELTGKLADVDGEFKSKKKDASSAAEGVKEFGESVGESEGQTKTLKESLKQLTGSVGGLWEKVKRIAVSMLIRNALKSVIKSIKAGISNVYQWSKLNKGTFASSMDSAATKVNLLKNSIGASLTPILNALIPIFNSLVSALVNVVNYLNQFWALLTGKSSWTRATETAEEYAAAANNASNKNKDLLASFDELNVITSTSSSSSSGSNTDYSNMFEEITEFDSTVRSLINYVEEHIDTIKGIAIAIGTALLGWKVSEAFSGLISTFAGLVAAGAVIAITAQVSWALTNQYLETGEIGWLIGDILTSALGSVIAGKLVANVLGGTAGLYAASFTLAFSALASIIALMQNTDVSAISQESLITTVVNALKVGAAAGLLGWASGASATTCIAGGAVATLTTIGVVLAIKTFLRAVKGDATKEETIGGFALSSLALGLAAGTYAKLFCSASWAGASVFAASISATALLTTMGVTVGIKTFGRAVEGDLTTEDALKGFGISSVSLGLAAGILKKMFVAGTTISSAAGFAAGASSALLLFSLGVSIGIKAYAKAVEGTLTTEEEIARIAGASIALGAGAAIVKKMFVPGASWASTFGFGLGVTGVSALVIFGVLTAVQATMKAQRADEITAEVVKDDAIASVVIGAAAAGIAIMASASLAGVLCAAGGAALVTYGVLVGIQSHLLTKKKDVIWGDYTLTQQQIQDYVSGYLFSASPKVVLSLIKDNITVGTTQREEIEKSLTEVLGTFNIIQLGIDTSEDYYAKLKEQIGDENSGLIKKVLEYSNSAQETASLTLQFTPTLVGDSEEDASEWFTNYVTGWDTVEKWVKDKGTEIGNNLVENEKGAIVEKTPGLTQTLMTQLTTVTKAIAEAAANSEAYANLRIAMGDLSQASGEEVIKLFTQYKNDLTTEYTNLVNEQYTKQGQLVAALFEIDPESDEYKQALEEYERMGKNLTQAVEDGVNAATEPGVKLIQEWLFGNHETGTVDTIWTENFLRGWLNTEGLTQTINDMLEKGGFEKAEIDAMNAIGMSGWEFLTKDAQEKLVAALGGVTNEETIQRLKDELGLTASDIINVSGFEDFSSEQTLEFVSALSDAYGSSEALAAAKEAGIDVEGAIAEGLNSDDESVKAAAEALQKIIEENADPVIDADAEVKPGAVGAVEDAIEGAKPVVATGASVNDNAKKGVKNAIEGIPNIKVVASAGVSDSGLNNVKSQINKTTGTVTASAEFKKGYPANLATEANKQTGKVTATAAFQNGYPANLATDVNKQTGTVTATSQFASGYPANLSKDVEKQKPTITATAEFTKSNLNKFKTELQKKIKDVKANVSNITASLKKGTTSELKDNIEDIKPTVTSSAGLASNAKTVLQDKLNKLGNLGVSVDPTLASGFTTTLSTEMKNAIKTSLTTMRLKARVTAGVMTLETMASGGTLKSGQIFIANENGKSEMIGKFGNQTGVANQEQMVEAMARGVQYANSEQNALLREQNRLLMGILQKEGNINIGASAALGRVAKQSIALYNTAAGV